MGFKDLCWCTNSHHPCGPSTTVSTQLVCTNLEHKLLLLFHLTAIYFTVEAKWYKNKDVIVNSKNYFYITKISHMEYDTAYRSDFYNQLPQATAMTGSAQ